MRAAPSVRRSAVSGSGKRLIDGVVLLVERIDFNRRLAAAFHVAGIPHDPEEPGAAVAAGKGAEVPQRPEGGVLHDVFGVVLVSHEPAGEPLRRTEMRQYDIIEALACCRYCVGCHPANVSEVARNNHRQRPHSGRTRPARRPYDPHGGPVELAWC